MCSMTAYTPSSVTETETSDADGSGLLTKLKQVQWKDEFVVCFFKKKIQFTVTYNVYSLGLFSGRMLEASEGIIAQQRDVE